MKKLTAAVLFFLAGSSVSGQQFIPKDLHAGYMKYWPASNDAFLNDLKGKVSIYTEKVVPMAFQFFGGVHSRVFAARPDGMNSDANREFPWGQPAGLHKTKNYKVLRFMYLPGPILYWRETRDNLIVVANSGQTMRREPITAWEYPKGTVFGEILTVQHPGGTNWTFEVRTRKKHGKGDWEPGIFRPFPTRESLDAALAKHDWIADIDEPVVYKLKSSHPGKIAFKRREYVATLPAMDDDLVKKLLAEPFQRVTGRWDGDVIAPTTDAEFGIVPKNFMGGMVRVSKRSCMSCHEDTLVSARTFDRNREWYGRVRGSDNIISFHIFEPSSISSDGRTRPIVLRQDLVQAGLLKEWK